jgi:alkaline phosphatase
MKAPQIQQSISFVAIAAVLIGSAQFACAAPRITRLTPPSALFSAGDPTPPIIARFLPDQRFDIQATIQPDPGQAITFVQFLVDNSPIPGAITLTSATGTAAGRTIATVRAYANSIDGVHLLTVNALQGDNRLVTAQGNFEIVPIKATGLAAKQVIIMIGDGMGIAHRTAARIMKNGVTLGKANASLSMDSFPFTGIVTTHSLNSIVTDSSPGASCYATGNKANNNQHGVFPDDTAGNNAVENGDNPRVESIGEYLHRTRGCSLGLVTTTDVFDSTPAAFGSHTQARAAGTGICDQYLDERHNTGLKVLMGGGRKWFLPAGTAGSGRTPATDYTVPADAAAAWGVPQGAVDANRDLLSQFQAAGFLYVADATQLNSIPADTERLLCLFNLSNMNVAKDKIDGRRAPPGSATVVSAYGFPDQPMLGEMTDKALQVLSRDTNGFVLMVEGGSIDKQAHLMDSDRWMIDTIEFDYAIERCRQFALANPDTLVIVTADHECAGANIIGGSRVRHAELKDRAALGGGTNQLRNGVVGTLELAGFPNYTLATDGYPITTDIDFRMLVGYACNADRYEDWITNPLPTQNASHGIVTSPPFGPQSPGDRDQAGNYFVVGQISDSIATHTASDIVLSAFGRGAGLFTGVMDNTDVFFKVLRAALGDNTVKQDVHKLGKYEGRAVPAEANEQEHLDE